MNDVTKRRPVQCPSSAAPTIRRPIQWRSSAATTVGTVRTINEDSIFSKPEIGLWAVADGMGGHEGGDIASQMIVNALDEIKEQTELTNFVTCIEDKIIGINERLLEYSGVVLGGRTVGSTIVILIIMGRVGACMWAGDSRLYRYRHDEIEQLTVDHSHVSELLRQGSISEAEAKNHPQANVITRAVGTCKKLDIDIDVFDVKVGDIFLLCSDGLYNSVQEKNIVHCLHEDDIEVAVKNLIQTSLHNKASDNVSVVLVKGVHSNIF